MDADIFAGCAYLFVVLVVVPGFFIFLVALMIRMWRHYGKDKS